MIASLLSHENRKRRRTIRARAMKVAVDLKITRVTSGEVAAHIVTLTDYLNNPSPQTLRELLRVEQPGNAVVVYLGKEKKQQAPTAADLAEAIEKARRERVLQVLTRNLLSGAVQDIQLEMALVAALSPAGEDPIEHLVLSWQEGEEPTSEQMEAVLDILLDVAGLSRHQAYAVVHGDTDNRHMHIAVNRVDPATGSRVQIGLGLERPIETLHQAIAIIEYRQGWKSQEAALYRADERGCADRSTGIMVRDAQMRVSSTAGQHQRIREQRARDKEERKISSSARDFERRTGYESLQRRVLATAQAIRQAGDWEAVHRALAHQGMRYRVLTSGAVIECGDRTIAASTAWGGASADKMTKRLGAFQAAAYDLEVAEFVDRVIPALSKVAEARREAQARREARLDLDDSVAGVRGIMTLAYKERVAAAAVEAPEELNMIRHEASRTLEHLDLTLRQLRSRRRRRRPVPRGDDIIQLEEEFGNDHEEGLAATLIGPLGKYVPPLPDSELVNAGYRADIENDHVAYRRGTRVCFVDHGDHVDLYRLDDHAIRDALRLAHRKWGRVHACGDKAFLDRLARIAVEEGIEITNPEIQTRIEAERRERAAAQARDPAPTQPAVMQVVPAVHLHKPDALRDYASTFSDWIDLANANVARGRVDAKAAAITADPELARQLKELESQQFPFARELRRAAGMFRRSQLAMLEQQQDEWSQSLPVGPPSVRERPGEQELASMGIALAPQSHAAHPAAVEDRPSPAPTKRQVPTSAGAAGRPGVGDLDERYFDIAVARRNDRVLKMESALVDALRQRVGSFDRPPRHIARLILRAAEQRKNAGHALRGSATTGVRDMQEIAALGGDATFSQLLALACGGDQATLERLGRAAAGPGDVLGRVTRGRDGRLDFAYRSVEGHDPDASAPLEWLERSLRHLDFTTVRLTRRNGRIGLTDKDLLEATYYNFAALLYPDVQARLEVEWRLQRERDVALLARISAGEVEVEIKLRADWRDFAADGDATSGASIAEREHLKSMLRDPAGYLAGRDVLRGAAAEKPLDASATKAALVRAEAELTSETVRRLLRQRLHAGHEAVAARSTGSPAVASDRGQSPASSPTSPGSLPLSPRASRSDPPVGLGGPSR